MNSSISVEALNQFLTYDRRGMESLITDRITPSSLSLVILFTSIFLTVHSIQSNRVTTVGACTIGVGREW